MHLGLPSSFGPGAAGISETSSRLRVNVFSLYQGIQGLAIWRIPAHIVAPILRIGSVATVLSCALIVEEARADEVLILTLKDHRFSPAELTVAAGERFRIELENLDSTPAEFESSELRVEKIVVGGGKITVRVGPLKPGTYRFFDDYHPDEAKGTITAIAPKPQQ